MRIALLDDDHAQLVNQAMVLKEPFVEDGEEIVCVPFSSGTQLKRSLARETYDLLVLDWNVPDLDGMALLRWLRHERDQSTPVLMLSSRGSEADVAHALLAGVDDYVVKPFRPLELRARLARLYSRRQVVSHSDALRFGNWEFDRSQNCVCVTRHGDAKQDKIHRILLTESEFLLALALFRNMSNVVSRDYLVDKAGFAARDDSSRTLDSHIYRLREKMELKGQHGVTLRTVYGKGYRLEPLSPA